MLYKMNGSPAVTKPSQSPFSDVKLTDGYFKAIYWAYMNNIISGYTQNGKTYFKPKDACTRGQIATLLWKMAGKPEPATTTNPYKDVKKSDGYYKAILWLGEKGIAKGKTESSCRRILARDRRSFTCCINMILSTDLWNK